MHSSLVAFANVSGTLILSHHNFILRLSLAVSTAIQNIFSISYLLQHGNRYLLTLQAVRNPGPYQHHPQRSTFLLALKGTDVRVGLPY